MGSKIQPLSLGVVTKLRSGVSITSVAHCVEELVLNSIDADANCIAVHLNLPLYQIQVIDNGNGIDADQLTMIGTRYVTSKCHTLEDLQNLKSGGFRGEALASLKEVSSVLMIESRAASSKETYCKIFTQGNSLQPKKSINPRPSKGTTVSVYDFMYNMPVRKNSISHALDLEECRKLLQCVALMHSDVSFTLRNDTTGEMCLQLKKSTSLYHTFYQIFGKNKADCLKAVEYQIDGFNLDGCISTDCHMTKDLQFLYINKRLVLRTKLHKLVNSVLNKVLSSKKLKYDMNGLTPNSSSPSKTQAQFCVFVLNISCSYDKYDIIFEPRKTMIEFSEWDEVLKLVEEALLCFLKKENLYLCIDKDKSVVSKSTASETANVLSFDVQDHTQGLFSHVARRLQVTSKHNNVPETSLVNKNVVDVTPIDSNLVQIEENVKSCDRISGIVCLRTDTSETSVLDTLKQTTVNVSTKTKDLTAAYSAPKLLATEFRIPCRSVFPSESPVMLRVPVKSTLSDLQSRCQNSKFFLKLKETFQYSPKKGKQFSLHKSEHDSSEKISYKSNRSTKLLQNNFSQNSSYLYFNQGKTKAKRYCNESHLNKASQCPSLSLNDHHQNIGSEVNISALKQAKDKSFQCPSVPSEKPKIISRFKFGKEPAILLPFQDFTQSTGLRRKNSIEDDIAAAESLLTDTSTENGVSPVKKLKCNPSFSQRTSYNIYAPSECENIDDEGNVFDLGVNYKMEAVNCLVTVPELQGFSEDNSKNSTSEIFKKPKTKNSTNTNLGNLNASSFNLQPFNELSDETDVMNKNLELVNFEISHCQQKETLCKHRGNPNSSDIYSFQESSSDEILDENTYFTENKQKSLSNIKRISNLKRCSYTDAENLDIEVKMVKKKAHVVNISKVSLDTMSPNFNAVKNFVSHADSDFCEVSKSNKVIYSPYVEHIGDAGSETLSDIAFDNKLENVLQESKSESVTSLALQNTNFELFSDEIMQVSKNDSSLIKFQYKSTDTLQEPKSNEINLFLPPNMLMNKLSPNANNISELENSDIKLDSEPFSESLLTVPKDQNTSQNSDNISNKHSIDDVLHIISKNTSFSELPNINEELSNNIKKTSEQDIQISNYNKFCNNGEKSGKICEENVKKTLDCNEEDNGNNGSTSSNIKDTIYVHSCLVDDKTNAECTKSDIVNKGQSILSRWKPHSEPETKRVIYIDTITGNSTYTFPNAGNSNLTSEINSGIKKSHFFLTHDYSPFISKTPSPTSKDLQVSFEFQNDLKDFIKNNEIYDWSRKWRSQKEDENYDSNIECMLNKWDNPMFNIPYEVTCVGGDKISQNLPQMYTFLNSYRFSPETLKTLKVIGQVDCKFIACILQNVNKNCTDQNILALFDQHAVHERIRLEELIEDLYETDSNGEKLIRTSSIYPHLAISFDSEEIRLLRCYHKKLYQIGIHLKIDGESHVCSIHSVPSCLIDKESNDFRRSRPDSIIILQNSITEWLSSLMKTRSIPQVLPKTLSSMLNSQACRGAVKFGDPLSLEQCKRLLESLSGCKLPFQCAHGRPSIAPILDLNKIQVLYKKRPSPQLWKLSKHL